MDLLKHELSHAVLYQNTTIRKGFRIPEWFREGLAIYYGNPHDNFVGEDFAKAAVDEGYFFDILNAHEEIQQIPLEDRYRFLHSEYRCFMEYLVEKFGIDAVRAYMKALLEEPEQDVPLFLKVFGANVKDVVNNFSQDVLAKKWP